MRNKTRIHLDMPPRVAERLERLTEAMDAASRAETIRRALAIAELVVTEVGEGSKIWAERSDGEYIQIKLV